MKTPKLYIFLGQTHIGVGFNYTLLARHLGLGSHAHNPLEGWQLFRPSTTTVYRLPNSVGHTHIFCSEGIEIWGGTKICHWNSMCCHDPQSVCVSKPWTLCICRLSNFFHSISPTQWDSSLKAWPISSMKHSTFQRLHETPNHNWWKVVRFRKVQTDWLISYNKVVKIQSKCWSMYGNATRLFNLMLEEANCWCEKRCLSLSVLLEFWPNLASILGLTNHRK